MQIAILIPCYNEEKTIAEVVKAFKSELPEAIVYVCDNNSTDLTAQEAHKAGAVVLSEKRQGKGYAMKTLLKSVQADIYVMVDGDSTYPADKVKELIQPVVLGEAEMVIGTRLHETSNSDFKLLNLVGNKMFLFVFNSCFKVKVTDLLSGYRAFSKELAYSLPIMSNGFEIETELTAKCIERNYRIVEIPIDLTPRPEGSKSKIKVIRDGILISKTIFALFRDHKPLSFFGGLGLLLIIAGLIPGVVVINEFIETGYIKRMPSAVLAVGTVLSGLISVSIGIILHTIVRKFKEIEWQIKNNHFAH